MSEQYCIYLRKSRADREAELRGDGETLSRHRATLLELAKKRNYIIGAIYEEIVSGDSISARPVMQQVLSEVEQGLWTGVLVMEVERLARGDTIDQGLVAQAFKYSNTLIVTPLKTFDPNNEFDEEYFEFGLFMSRREYKTIKRRLQNGTLAALKEGKYTRSVAPYGYERVKIKNDKGYTLAPLSGEAEIVQMIFELFTKGELQEDGTYKRLGTALITRRLNDLGVKPRHSAAWMPCTIRDILRNEHYTGKIIDGKRKRNKKVVNGTPETTYSRSKEYNVYPGLHPALVSEETFATANNYLSLNKPRGKVESITNPLAGIVICAKCGRCMVRRPYGDRQEATIMCPSTACDNVSSKYHYIEEAILTGLENWAKSYTVEEPENDLSSQIEAKRKLLEEKQNELSSVSDQINNIYTLLEQGIYDTETFLKRQQIAKDQKQNILLQIDTIEKEISQEEEYILNRNNIIPRIYSLIECYDKLPDAASKNEMLKQVIDKVVYLKTSNGWYKEQREDDFSIDIFPKLPEK
jgi:DNA invertase Pin-like site-specific DNA recombinase